MSDSEVKCEDKNGISFVTAIERRYIETCIIPKEVLELPQNVGKQRTIELIGFEKSFEKLIEVNVSQMNISFCGNDCQSLKQVLSKTKALVLSKNLFTEWSEVAKIVRNMQSLTDLVLSYNKLKLPIKQTLDLHSFESIKTLIIDNLDYKWKDILFCAQMWPNIERLDVWGNLINVMESPTAPLFTHLSYLSVCNNNISEWTEVCKMGFLPNLKSLNVSDCKIKEIRFDDSDLSAKSKLFRQLECLLISNNYLSEWRDIAELNKLEKLENLLIKNNPVFDNQKYETNFNLILSRIKNLKFLNKEKITQVMRKDAEIGYLRKFFKHYESIKSNEQLFNEFMLNNPCFEHILSEYGTPFGSNVSKEELNRKKFLTLKLQNPFDKESKIEKKIPGILKISNFFCLNLIIALITTLASISLINLKTIIRRLFDIDFNYDINLLWTSKDFECPLDKDSQNLNFYSIENGDIIVVNIEKF